MRSNNTIISRKENSKVNSPKGLLLRIRERKNKNNLDSEFVLNFKTNSAKVMWMKSPIISGKSQSVETKFSYGK